MTSATFLDLLNFDTASDGAASSKRRRRRLPVPLALEQLEDRTVPDATVNFNGPLNVAAASFSPQPVQFAPFLTATPVFVAGANFLSLSNQNLPLLTISGVNSVGPSAGLTDLFGLNAVNSSGQANPLAPRPWQQDAFGFGSGTEPGEPWAPAYMNVGLANQQGQAQNLPWGRTITYGQGSGARADGGNAAVPRAGGGGAAPQPGDANKPDKGDQPNAPKQKQEDDRKDRKEGGPKKDDQKDKGQKKEAPKQNDQPQNTGPKEQRPADKSGGVNDPTSQVLLDRSGAILGIDAKERMATIDRILSDERGDEKDEAVLDGVSLTDPAVVAGSLLLNSVHAAPFAALFPNEPTAEEAFAGGNDGESMSGTE
jgi:hypothetical protein